MPSVCNCICISAGLNFIGSCALYVLCSQLCPVEKKKKKSVLKGKTRRIHNIIHLNASMWIAVGKEQLPVLESVRSKSSLMNQIEFDSLKCWRLMLTFLLCLNDAFTIPLCFHIYLYCLNGWLYGERIYKVSVHAIMKCFGAYFIQLQTQLIEYQNAILPIW